MSQGGLVLLLRLNKSWYAGISAKDLYEITRGWRVMSLVAPDREVYMGRDVSHLFQSARSA